MNEFGTPPRPSTTSPSEVERRYLLCLLTVAEELLALMPEQVKKKYGLIKGTLAVRLGSQTMLPQDSAILSSLAAGILPHVASTSMSPSQRPTPAAARPARDRTQHDFPAFDPEGRTRSSAQRSLHQDLGSQGQAESEDAGMARSLLSRHQHTLRRLAERVLQHCGEEGAGELGEEAWAAAGGGGSMAQAVVSCSEHAARLERALDQLLQHSVRQLPQPASQRGGREDEEWQEGGRGGRMTGGGEERETFGRALKASEEALEQATRMWEAAEGKARDSAERAQDSERRAAETEAAAAEAEAAREEAERRRAAAEAGAEERLKRREEELREEHERRLQRCVRELEQQRRQGHVQLERDLEAKHQRALAQATGAAQSRAVAAEGRAAEAEAALSAARETHRAVSARGGVEVQARVRELEAENKRLRRTAEAQQRAQHQERASYQALRAQLAQYQGAVSAVSRDYDAARRSLHKHIARAKGPASGSVPSPPRASARPTHRLPSSSASSSLSLRSMATTISPPSLPRKKRPVGKITALLQSLQGGEAHAGEGSSEEEGSSLSQRSGSDTDS